MISLTVSWSAPTSSLPIQGYVVGYRISGSSNTYNELKILDTTSANIVGILSDVTYEGYVKSFSGNGVYSNISTWSHIYNTPTPHPTPNPTPSPTPAPTPAPTPSPTPAPTPFPTPSPSPGATPAPVTPSPTPAPLPPGSTPYPTPTPTPSPTPSPVTPSPTPAPVVACPNTCGTVLSDSWGSDSYTTQTKCLNLTARTTGDVISLSVQSYDRPNTFTVRASNGNGVASSGWLGYADYAGSWGSSLSNSGMTTLTFTYDSNLTYTLEVEIGEGNGTSDGWSANLSCSTPSAPTPPPTTAYIGSGLTICGGQYLYYTNNLIPSGGSYFVPGTNTCYISAGYITSTAGLVGVFNGTTSVPCNC